MPLIDSSQECQEMGRQREYMGAPALPTKQNDAPGHSMLKAITKLWMCLNYVRSELSNKVAENRALYSRYTPQSYYYSGFLTEVG